MFLMVTQYHKEYIYVVCVKMSHPIMYMKYIAALSLKIFYWNTLVTYTYKYSYEIYC